MQVTLAVIISFELPDLEKKKTKHSVKRSLWHSDARYEPTSKTTTKDLQTSDASFSSVTLCDKTGHRRKEITEALAFHSGEAVLPIYTVEEPGFVKMLKTINRKYEPLSCKYFAEVAFPREDCCVSGKDVVILNNNRSLDLQTVHFIDKDRKWCCSYIILPLSSDTYRLAPKPRGGVL